MATSGVNFTLAGKFRVTAVLGKGGFGTVYRATDTTLDREVALKVLHTVLSADPNFVSRFRTEAKAIANLRHPNIVGIYELGEDDGRQFIAMELMPGGTLRDRLAAGGPIAFAKALSVLRQVASGLEAAHQKGMVHRDVKPANILFAKDGQAAISDFGLVRAAQFSVNSDSSGAGGVGTPFYKAPELWRGKPPASPATDVYALGCVTFEMLTGRTLFSGETPDEVITKHLVEDPDFGAGWPPADAPAGLAAVVARAVSRKPDDRYPTAGGYASALDGLMLEKPVAAAALPGQSTGAESGSEATLVSTAGLASTLAPANSTINEREQSSAVPPAESQQIEPPPVATIIVSPPAKGDAFEPAAPLESITSPTAAEMPYQPIQAVEHPATEAQFRQTALPTPTVLMPATPKKRISPWVWVVGLLLFGCCGLGLLILPSAYVGLQMVLATANAPIVGSHPASASPTAVVAISGSLTATKTLAATPGPGAPTTVPFTAVPMPTVLPTLAPTKTPQPTTTPSPTAPPLPVGMVLARAGTFKMGSTAFGNTAPVHSVTLDAFYIDQFEVVNDQYHQCVAAGACTDPGRRSTDTRGKYYDDRAFGSFPVSNITWQQAQDYCQWQHKRLPTEAEWEYAATGGDGRRYPWGDTFDASLVPIAASDTAKVGSFPGNASPFGAEDMAGNVVEWVSDWYLQNYYATSPSNNPTGPATGTLKVTRGGAFGNPDSTLYMAARRFTRAPNLGDVDIGFRCVLPVPK